MLIIFPCDFFNKNQVESMYESEYEAIKTYPDIEVSFFNYDDFAMGKTLELTMQDNSYKEAIYRGWMMKPELYSRFYSELEQKNIKLINTPTEYNACHLFQNTYPKIKEYTPEILYFPTRKVNWGLVNDKFERFFIKDEVKSVKGSDFPQYFSTPVDSFKTTETLDEFTNLRGSLLTGGFIIKEFVDLKLVAGCTNEYRVFYYKGQVVAVFKNSGSPDSADVLPVDLAEKFVHLDSNFYTVDFAQLDTGSWVIIETGDGQVSGLPSEKDTSTFYEAIAKIDKLK